MTLGDRNPWVLGLWSNELILLSKKLIYLRIWKAQWDSVSPSAGSHPKCLKGCSWVRVKARNHKCNLCHPCGYLEQLSYLHCNCCLPEPALAGSWSRTRAMNRIHILYYGKSMLATRSSVYIGTEIAQVLEKIQINPSFSQQIINRTSWAQSTST